MLSGGVGGEQQRPGRLRDRRGAAGKGEAGEAVRVEEDQAGGHDDPVPAGRLCLMFDWPDLPLQLCDPGQEKGGEDGDPSQEARGPGSKSIYSTTLSQIGSCTNLQSSESVWLPNCC